MVHIKVPVSVVVRLLSVCLSFLHIFLHAVFVDKSPLSTLLLVLNLSNHFSVINIFRHRAAYSGSLTYVWSVR